MCQSNSVILKRLLLTLRGETEGESMFLFYLLYIRENRRCVSGGNKPSDA